MLLSIVVEAPQGLFLNSTQQYYFHNKYSTNSINADSMSLFGVFDGTKNPKPDECLFFESCEFIFPCDLVEVLVYMGVYIVVLLST